MVPSVVEVRRACVCVHAHALTRASCAQVSESVDAVCTAVPADDRDRIVRASRMRRGAALTRRSARAQTIRVVASPAVQLGTADALRARLRSLAPRLHAAWFVDGAVHVEGVVRSERAPQHVTTSALFGRVWLCGEARTGNAVLPLCAHVRAHAEVLHVLACLRAQSAAGGYAGVQRAAQAMFAATRVWSEHSAAQFGAQVYRITQVSLAQRLFVSSLFSQLASAFRALIASQGFQTPAGTEPWSCIRQAALDAASCAPADAVAAPPLSTPRPRL